VIKRVLLAVILILLPVVAAYGQSERQKAPALTLKDLRGRGFRLSDYKGKILLLNFWATWCPPCRAEMPELVKMQRAYHNRGLQIIGITYPPQRSAEVRQLARKLRVNYPIALGTKVLKMLFDTNDTLPLTVIIDRDGFILDRIEGILLPEEFEQKIKPLLQ
jgi:thiol-disulfide isomerase/thioredoxin